MAMLDVTPSQDAPPAHSKAQPPSDFLPVIIMSKRKPYNGPRINIDPDDVLDTEQAAKILGVSDREVRAKIARGTLPAIKIINKYFINRKAVQFYEYFSNLHNRRRKQLISASSPKLNKLSSCNEYIYIDDFTHCTCITKNQSCSHYLILELNSGSFFS